MTAQSLREAIQVAAGTPIDDSERFTERVRELRAYIGAGTGFIPDHSDHMNYRSGQVLTLYLDQGERRTSSEAEARYALKVLISSRGPLFALQTYTVDGNVRNPVPQPQVTLTGHSASTVSRVRAALTEAGLLGVTDDLLDELVPNHVTEMDGAPASVRDVLFCELC